MLCCVVVIENLCNQLNCDQMCEVAMTQARIAVPYCVCTVGFVKVRVSGGTPCNCKWSAFCLAVSVYFFVMPRVIKAVI